MTTEKVYNTHLDIEQPRVVKRTLKELAISHTKVTVQAIIDELEDMKDSLEYAACRDDVIDKMGNRIEQLKNALYEKKEGEI